ncbi:uncharacterized protein LOC117569966 isoform X2 [Drosophila albomicans]|uniref:Uncharacterized protein LOC117569966 isoform X2 n=1 Tax=Drosophila albomicans TaxID=7291 RepID=A0A6P8WU76_DROAB|nr:uncharacterized protein LOC117569966 isoform X2 [Drosophila albomicans]
MEANATATTPTTTAAATTTPTSLQRVASQASLVQAAPTHHYHYIQYPAHYLQQQQQQQQQTNGNSPVAPQQCQCPCSCGRATALQQQLPQQQQQQQQQNASMAVAVLVHQQTSTPAPQSTLKTQSAQSLLNHSYQALHDEEQQQQQSPTRERLNLPLDSSVASCDCDLECTCPNGNAASSSLAQQQLKRSLLADAMLGADEITVSESDNNSTMIKKKKQRSNGGHGAGQLPSKSQPPTDSCNDIYHDTELEVVAAVAAAAAVGGGSKSQGLDDNRPPLPPRPPPRPRSAVNGSIAHRHGAGIKKYVVWCLICGGFSCLLGVLFLGVYFLLHSYTITVGNFETVPTFVPATLLILTGVCIMSLARRRNRYSYLIKLSGACGLVSALTCALVTVTTTVLHMSRLQALRECEYAQKTRTCTCYSDLIESQVDRVDKGVRLVFDSLSDCGVVHGSLYSCLRAIFGLSVAGVLIAVFSCMLVYQLLSHERKKMYWEQLELRCRSLYASQAPPPHSLGALTAPGRMLNCRCCEQCHAHRQLTLPLQATAYPWDEASAAAAAAVAAGGAGAEQRFWATQPPGNFYSPNPGGNEELVNGCRGGGNERASRNNSSGWSWPRMPWQRNTPDATRRFRQAAASPDSQYGFSSATAVAVADGNQMLIEEPTVNGSGGAYNALPPPNALPYGVWGPPPPYSDPNSPARRGYYQYLQASAYLAGGNAAVTTLMPQQLQQEQLQQLQQHQQQQHQQQQQQQLLPQQLGQQARGAGHAATLERMDGLNAGITNGSGTASTVSTRSVGVTAAAYKSKAVGNGEYENTHSDSDGCNGWERDRCSNTLPTRKLKKRIIEAGAKSIGPQNNANAQRPNVQQLFACEMASKQQELELQPAEQQQLEGQQTVNGVENSGYQDSNGAIAKGQAAVIGTVTSATTVAAVQLEAAESEVYFADVSSCCNMSVKNDNYYDNATQQQQQRHPHPHQHQHQHQHSNCSHSSSNLSNSNNNNEDYLAQRFGRREHSIRSRLPIPQTSRRENDDDDYESSNLNMPTLKSAALEQQQQQLQKDISRQSMCSVESEAKTEFTDLSPSTPCTLLPPPPASFASDTPSTTPAANFVASFPYSSESQCLEAHRRSTKNIHELLLAGNSGGSGNDATHYEIINDRDRYQLQRSVGGGSSSSSSNNNKHKSKSKSRSREQLDIYGAGTERADWSDSSGCAALRGSSKRL